MGRVNSLPGKVALPAGIWTQENPELTAHSSQPAQQTTAALRSSACISRALDQPTLKHQPRQEAFLMPQLDMCPLIFISPACPACHMSASLGLGPHLDPPPPRPAAHGLRPQTEEVFIECIELTLKGPSPRPYMGRTVGQRSESPFRADKVLF